MRRVALLVAGLVLAGAAAYAVERPDPAVQAAADGCRRDLPSLFQRTAPTWVYLNDRDAPASGPPPPPQWASGVADANGDDALASHPTAADDPVSHDSYDYNLNLRVDPAYSFLVGGREDAKTGNFEGEGESTGRLHSERESGSLPFFVWPDPGDRVQELGSWVWDCGHWQPGGERTEFHPIRALLVVRRTSARSPYGEREGDVYVTSDPTPAGLSAECAHRTKGDGGAFKACLASAPRPLDVSGTYRLVLPLPLRPSPASRRRLRLVRVGGTVMPQVSATSDGRSYTLSFELGAQPATVAFEAFAGWTHVPAVRLPDHLRLRFTSLLVRRAMDPGCLPHAAGCVSKESTLDGQITQAPGEWNLYWDVAGIWGLWSPTVLYVHDGQVVPGHQTIDFYVAPGQSWRFETFGRECDTGGLSFSDVRRAPYPCPASGEADNGTSDDAPGVVDRRVSRLGPQRADPLPIDSTCPPSNRRGCYQVAFTVTRIDDAARRAR